MRLGQPVQDRGTLAGVGYLHEGQAFPQYLSATTLLRYYGALAPGARSSPAYTGARIVGMGRVDRSGAGTHLGLQQGNGATACFGSRHWVNDPELLVLDEPTEGMDLVARKLLYDVIRRRKQEGKTAILVFHSMADVLQVGDLAAVLRGGEVVFQGSLADLAGKEPADCSAHTLQEALEPMYAGAST